MWAITKPLKTKKKSTNIFPFKIKKLWINIEFVVSFRWNSKTTKAENYIDKKVTNLTRGRISSNPDTHLGKKISDFTGKKLDQIFQRRNQNRGASDLKGSTSGIG